MKQKSFAQLTRELTGMTKEQYKKSFNKFMAQVRNYNRVSGTQYQAAREFYYSYRFAGMETEALKAIKATKASKAHGKDEFIPLGKKSLGETKQTAKDVLEAKWGNFIAKSEANYNDGIGGDAYIVKKSLDDGEITVAEANAMLAKIKKETAKKSDDDPASRY